MTSAPRAKVTCDDSLNQTIRPGPQRIVRLRPTDHCRRNARRPPPEIRATIGDGFENPAGSAIGAATTRQGQPMPVATKRNVTPPDRLTRIAKRTSPGHSSPIGPSPGSPARRSRIRESGLESAPPTGLPAITWCRAT